MGKGGEGDADGELGDWARMSRRHRGGLVLGRDGEGDADREVGELTGDEQAASLVGRTQGMGPRYDTLAVYDGGADTVGGGLAPAAKGH